MTSLSYCSHSTNVRLLRSLSQRRKKEHSSTPGSYTCQALLATQHQVNLDQQTNLQTNPNHYPSLKGNPCHHFEPSSRSNHRTFNQNMYPSIINPLGTLRFLEIEQTYSPTVYHHRASLDTNHIGTFICQIYPKYQHSANLACRLLHQKCQQIAKKASRTLIKTDKAYKKHQLQFLNDTFHNCITKTYNTYTSTSTYTATLGRLRLIDENYTKLT